MSQNAECAIVGKYEGETSFCLAFCFLYAFLQPISIRACAWKFDSFLYAFLQSRESDSFVCSFVSFLFVLLFSICFSTGIYLSASPFFAFPGGTFFCSLILISVLSPWFWSLFSDILTSFSVQLYAVLPFPRIVDVAACWILGRIHDSRNLWLFSLFSDLCLISVSLFTDLCFICVFSVRSHKSFNEQRHREAKEQ